MMIELVIFGVLAALFMGGVIFSIKAYGDYLDRQYKREDAIREQRKKREKEISPIMQELDVLYPGDRS